MGEPARVVGIAGGSCAGKTTLARALADRLGDACNYLAFDEYYRDHGHLTVEDRALVNYDHLDSLDDGLFLRHLDDLTAGRPVDVPVYDFATHCRTDQTRTLQPRPMVVADGILLFAIPGITDRLDLSVFVDAPEELRLARRIYRDVRERGRTAESVQAQFEATVAPSHRLFVQPFREGSDLVVTGEGDPRPVVDEILARLT
ncbi:MAG: uridine kinase [Actinobacteria bacterium]|nr:uridine kinase [Actinomycetota bacterium]